MSASDFWSRRKAAVAAETIAEERAAEATEAVQRDAALEERGDADILAELELPDPDTLEQGDDFTAFLAKAVPSRIRTRALRRLWATNPVLANIDGLVDYGGDFTDASCAIENLQTAYQVGKGMTKHVEDLARQAEQLAGADDTQEPGEEGPVETGEPADILPEAAPAALALAEAEDDGDAEAEDLPPTPAPRRMRFAFDAAGETEVTETA